MSISKVDKGYSPQLSPLDIVAKSEGVVKWKLCPNGYSNRMKGIWTPESYQ
jgi:hypothetical protein